MSISFDSVVEDIYGTGLLKGLHLILDDRAITGSSVLYSLCSHFKQHSSEDARVINADLSYDRRRLTLKLKEMFKGQIQVFNMAPDVGNMRDHKIATHYSEKFKALICTIKKHNGADLLVIVNGLEEALLGAPQSLILNHLCSLRGVVDEHGGGVVVLLAPGPREKASIYSGACEHLVRVAELVIRIEPFRTGATQLAVGKIEIHRGGMRIRGDPGAKNIDKVTKTIQLSVEPGSGGMRVSRKGYAAGTL